MDLFAPTELSQTEQDIVASTFEQPAVQRFLKALANEAIKDIVFGEPAINETPESYLRRQALVKGRLEAVNTLLQIQAAPKQ